MPATAYELMLITRADLDEVARTVIIDKVKSLVTKAKGSTWHDANDWGSKTLSYEIEKQKNGWYYLLLFDTDGDTLADVVRTLRITDGVMRAMAVHRVPESEVEPPVFEDRPKDRGRGGRQGGGGGGRGRGRD